MAYDLEEQESLDQLKAWWDKWGNLVLSAVTVGSLAFAAWNGWNYYQRSQGAKATNAYIQLQNAVVQRDEKNIKSMADGLMREYSGHVFATLAALSKAGDAVRKNDLNAAREALTWVLEKGHPEYANIARIRLAGVEIDAKNAKKALEVLAAVKPLAGEEPVYYDRLGDVHYAMGDYAKAREAWQKALKADERDQVVARMIELKIQALPNA